MSKNQTIIIVRNPDSAVPEAYLRKVLAEATSCGGYAVQTKDDDGNPMIVSDRLSEAIDLDAVQELLKGYASERVLLAFSKLEKVQENFLQPFDLTLPGDSAPLMSFAIEGDFPSMAEAGTTQEANLAKRVLLPNLNKFLKYSDGDLDKFIAELKDDTFVDSIMARIGDRGQFVFLPPVGEAILQGKNKIGSFFPWGYVSNTLGYSEEAPKKVETPVAEKKKGWWGKSKGPSLPVAEDKPVETKPAETPAPVEPKEDTVVKDAPIIEPSPQDTSKPPAGEWKEVPRGLSKKDRKAFIRRVTGCGNALPDGWEKLNFKYWSVEYPSAAKEITKLQEKFNTGHAQPKDMRSSKEPAKVENKQPSRGSEVISEANSLVLTAEEKSEVETTLLKIMDRRGNAIPDPTQIQKMEEKYPKFTAQFGVTNEQIDTWAPRDIETVAKNNPKAFFHMFLEVRRDRIEARAALASSTKTEPEKVEVKEETKASVPEKKVANGGWSKWGKK